MIMKSFIVLLLLIITFLSPDLAYAQTGKLLFGIGPEANDAIHKPLTQETPIKILTSWYNGPKDLTWMRNWKTGTVPASYAKGYILHLIVYSNDPEKNIQTSHGDACGRQYPVSENFKKDMEQLADIFKGNGSLYVTLFTEFQTYPCKDNQWKQSENYYNALKDQYRTTRQIFKSTNPNAKISIGWGGWQARYDDKSNGGGKALFSYFEDIMKESDFQSFQSMQSDHNIEDIRDMTTILSKFGPVMLAHYKPDNRSQQTFDRDLESFFTDDYINEITSKGLFAMSFMDHTNLSNSSVTYNLTKNAVIKYAATQDISIKKNTPISSTTPTASPQIIKQEESVSQDQQASEFTSNNYIENQVGIYHIIVGSLKKIFNLKP